MIDATNNITNSLATVFLALWICIFCFFKKSYGYWKKRGVDYLEPLTPFGNIASLIFKQCTLGEMFARLYLRLKKKGAKHGGIYFFWKPVYIPVDADIIKRILITDFENFQNRGFYISEKNDPLSGHLFTMENDTWRTLRSKLPSVFTSAKMRKMFLIMEEMTKQFVKNLDVYAESSSPVNLKTEAVKLTTDMVTACTFGIESKTMTNENKELLKHGRLFFDSQFNIYTNATVVMIPRHILQKLNFRVITKETEKYFINLCKNIANYRKENQQKRGDLTDTLLRLTEKNEHVRDFTGSGIMEPLTPGQFTAQMYVFFAAGFETTSSTETFAAYELAKNPDCQVKLRQEIQNVLEKYNNIVTYDAVMEMRYLDQVVNETLRLYPVLPFVTRVCMNDYKIPGTEVTIEKNTLVTISSMGIHRDPEYYPDPEKFDPERFSNKNKSGRPFVSYLPFGEGPRICIGKRFGLLQAKVGIIAMVRNYEISLNEDKTKSSFKFEPDELLLRKVGDIWINLKKIII